MIGGDDPQLPIEVYDTETEHWQVLSGILNMYDDRLYLPGAAVLADRIYLIGGWKGEDDAYDDIKCFDTSTEKWNPNCFMMKIARGSLTASTVRLPKNYFAKTFPMTLIEK